MKHLLQEEFEKEFSFAVECCVRGYHFFQSFWEASVSSVLIAKHEDDPHSLVHDKFVVKHEDDPQSLIHDKFVVKHEDDPQSLIHDRFVHSR